MPRKIGEKIPDRLSFTFTKPNRDLVQKSMENKEFKTVAEAINTCINYYYENRDKTGITKEWMLSEEGEEYIKNIMRKVRDNE